MEELELMIKELINTLEHVKEKYQKEIEIMSKKETASEEIIECTDKIDNHLRKIEILEKRRDSKNNKLLICAKFEKFFLQLFLGVPIILSAISFYLMFVDFPVALVAYGITATISATLLISSIKLFQKTIELDNAVKVFTSEIEDEENSINDLKELINQLNLSLSSDVEAKHKEIRLEISACEELIWNMIDNEVLNDSEYVEELRKSFYPTIYMPNSLGSKSLSLKRN